MANMGESIQDMILKNKSFEHRMTIILKELYEVYKEQQIRFLANSFDDQIRFEDWVQTGEGLGRLASMVFEEIINWNEDWLNEIEREFK